MQAEAHVEHYIIKQVTSSWSKKKFIYFFNVLYTNIFSLMMAC